MLQSFRSYVRRIECLSVDFGVMPAPVCRPQQVPSGEVRPVIERTPILVFVSRFGCPGPLVIVGRIDYRLFVFFEQRIRMPGVGICPFPSVPAFPVAEMTWVGHPDRVVPHYVVAGGIVPDGLAAFDCRGVMRHILVVRVLDFRLGHFSPSVIFRLFGCTCDRNLFFPDVIRNILPYGRDGDGACPPGIDVSDGDFRLSCISLGRAELQ